MTKEKSLKEQLVKLLEKKPLHLTEIYAKFPNTLKHSIRARLNENVGVLFIRVRPGVYRTKRGA